jgi:hypothetical protein
MLPVMRFLAGIDSIKDFGGRDGASLTDFWGLWFTFWRRYRVLLGYHIKLNKTQNWFWVRSAERLKLLVLFHLISRHVGYGKMIWLLIFGLLMGDYHQIIVLWSWAIQGYVVLVLALKGSLFSMQVVWMNWIWQARVLQGI